MFKWIKKLIDRRPLIHQTSINTDFNWNSLSSPTPTTAPTFIETSQDPILSQQSQYNLGFIQAVQQQQASLQQLSNYGQSPMLVPRGTNLLPSDIGMQYSGRPLEYVTAITPTIQSNLRDALIFLAIHDIHIPVIELSMENYKRLLSEMMSTALLNQAFQCIVLNSPMGITKIYLEGTRNMSLEQYMEDNITIKLP